MEKAWADCPGGLTSLAVYGDATTPELPNNPFIFQHLYLQVSYLDVVCVINPTSCSPLGTEALSFTGCIEPLLQLKHLRTIHIKLLGVSLAFSEHDLISIARNWEESREIWLDCVLMGDNIVPDFDAVYRLLLACPYLRDVHLPGLRARVSLVPPPQAMNQSLLNTLSSTLLAVDYPFKPQVIVEHLISLFPSLQWVGSVPCVHPGADWAQLRELLLQSKIGGEPIAVLGQRFWMLRPVNYSLL
ncbi:hypothetical protein OH77DRAFT_154073 [Trametes cingulata]|nr:hypothetical protein OH77DRAFT_154073 [Trametes cingulata]